MQVIFIQIQTQKVIHNSNYDFDGMVTASTPTGLPLHTLIDTGCHKTLLSKKIYDQHKKHFQNFYEIPFLEKHFYYCGKWTTNCCTQNDSIAFTNSEPLF